MSLGTSCQNCTWKISNNRVQTGCSLDRLRFPHVQVTDFVDKFFVLTENLCSAYRSQGWLDKMTGTGVDPMERIRKELYPKVQLIIIAKTYDDWKLWLDRNDLSKFSSIDVLAFADFNSWLKEVKSPYTIHICANTIEHQINHFVNPRTSSLYLVWSSPLEDLPIGIVDNINHKINDNLSYLMMVRPRGEAYNGLLVNSSLHNMVFGFGEAQSVAEKIEIDSQNNGYSQYVYNSLEDLNG